MKFASAASRRVLKTAARAIAGRGLILPGDRVLAALSGGKDSWTMLRVLARLRAAAPIPFELEAVTIDPGFPGFEPAAFGPACATLGVGHQVVASGIERALRESLTPGTNPCALCARLRRGALYGLLRAGAGSVLALGHHADDRIETLLLSEFYQGYIGAMPAALVSADGLRVIRPLASVFERDITSSLAEWDPPLAPCPCPAGIRPEGRRRRMKRLLDELETETPGVRRALLAALGDIRPERF